MFLKISEDIISVLRPLKTNVPVKKQMHERQWREWAPLLPESEPLNLVFKTKGELNPHTKYWVVVEPRIGDRGGQVGTSASALPPGIAPSPWGGHWEVRVYPASKPQEEITIHFSRLELTLEPVQPGPVSRVWPLNCGGCLYTVPEGQARKEIQLSVDNKAADSLLAVCEKGEAEIEDRELGEKVVVPCWRELHLGVAVFDNRTKDGRAKKRCTVVKFFDAPSAEPSFMLYDDDGNRGRSDPQALLRFGKVRELELVENSAYYFRNRDGHYLALTDETHCVEFVSGRDKVTIGAELVAEPVRRRQQERRYRSPKDMVRLLMSESEGGMFAAWAPDKFGLTMEDVVDAELELLRQEQSYAQEYKRWGRAVRKEVQLELFRRKLLLERARKALETLRRRVEAGGR